LGFLKNEKNYSDSRIFVSTSSWAFKASVWATIWPIRYHNFITYGLELFCQKMAVPLQIKESYFYKIVVVNISF
jgi:hypothetical protein